MATADVPYLESVPEAELQLQLRTASHASATFVVRDVRLVSDPLANARRRATGNDAADPSARQIRRRHRDSGRFPELIARVFNE